MESGEDTGDPGGFPKTRRKGGVKSRKGVEWYLASPGYYLHLQFTIKTWQSLGRGMGRTSNRGKTISQQVCSYPILSNFRKLKRKKELIANTTTQYSSLALYISLACEPLKQSWLCRLWVWEPPTKNIWWPGFGKPVNNQISFSRITVAAMNTAKYKTNLKIQEEGSL